MLLRPTHIIAVPIIFAMLLLIGCCSSRFTPSPLENEGSRFEFTHTPEPHGVFLMVHGLNQRPSSMNPLAEFLRSRGYHTYRLTLTGHGAHAPQPFSSTEWERDLLAAYSHIASTTPDLPIHILGYSLGGLLAARAVDSYPTVRPASMILFAPGLSLRLLTQSAYILTLFPPLTTEVRNLAPAGYKRFQYTPLFWYRNTIDLYDKTRRLSSDRLARTPTLVFSNPSDELVSKEGLEDWITDNHLESSWRVVSVRSRQRTPLILDHIIIDETSLGPTEWNRVKRSIEGFLAGR